MPTGSRIYLSKHAVGDQPKCIVLLHELARALAAWNVQQMCVYYSGELLWNQDDLDRALVKPTEFDDVTEGRFPAVWLILNYNLGGVSEQRLTEFEARFGLQVIRSGVTSPDRFA